MGTRGLYGFRKNGKDKVTYNHWDSYPEGLGIEVIRFCNRHSIEELSAIYDKIVLIDEESTPTPEEIEWAKCRGLYDPTVSNRSEQNWYCLLRGLQGDLLRLDIIISSGDKCYMIDNHGFITDSLMCEYAYIINIDTGKLEFWAGFQEVPQKGNRYGEEPYPRNYENAPIYYPCAMVAEFPLDELNEDTTVAEMIKLTEEEN